MQKSNAALVITSIASPDPVLRDYAGQCQQRGVVGAWELTLLDAR